MCNNRPGVDVIYLLLILSLSQGVLMTVSLGTHMSIIVTQEE